MSVEEINSSNGSSLAMSILPERIFFCSCFIRFLRWLDHEHGQIPRENYVDDTMNAMIMYTSIPHFGYRCSWVWERTWMNAKSKPTHREETWCRGMVAHVFTSHCSAMYFIGIEGNDDINELPEVLDMALSFTWGYLIIYGQDEGCSEHEYPLQVTRMKC